jgi:hypothetical protein
MYIFLFAPEAKPISPFNSKSNPNVLVAVVEVAVIYATVGLVEALIVVPLDESHPCPKVVAPVPPFATVRALVRARVLAVNVVPLKVRLDESVNKPPVVAYGTRPEVRPETMRLVVEAVVAVIIVVEAYGKTEAVEVVAVKYAATVWPLTERGA